MYEKLRPLAWFHAYLILWDGIAALRSGGDADQLIDSEGDRVSLKTPPAWVKGGCKAKKGNRCAWWRCKHTEYKTRLEQVRNESEVWVSKKYDLRSMTEKEKQRYLEGKFLFSIGTERLMHKMITYAFLGENEKCSWTEEAFTAMEDWLRVLLPMRHECLQEVIDQHGRSEGSCIEGFTNNFKADVRKSCKELEFPDYVPARVAQTRWWHFKHKHLKVSNPYKATYKGAVAATAAGGAVAGVFSGMIALVPFSIFFAMLGIGLAFPVTIPVAALISFISLGLIAPFIAYMICRTSRKKREGYHSRKYEKKKEREAKLELAKKNEKVSSASGQEDSVV